jgi:hypothetical protein
MKVRRVKKISVISIAKTEEELEPLRKMLSTQSYQDFEFISSTKGTIPEAWNDAISRAKGEYLVFTESDAMPLNNQWLEEISSNLKKNTVIKGIEINPSDLNMCNLACDALIFKQERFDTGFKCAEDTELFARLRKKGVTIERVNAFPVFHSPRQSWKKTLNRGFLLGLYFMKIIYLHGRANIEDHNTMSNGGQHIHPISNRIRIIIENVLVLLGLLFGAILYIPTYLRNDRIKE